MKRQAELDEDVTYSLKRCYSLSEKIIYENQLNILYATLFTKSKATDYFRKLEEEVVYLKSSDTNVTIFGKSYPIPRKLAAYGDENISYTFSGLTISAKPWTSTMIEIKRIVEDYSGETFNFALINRYEDGKQTIGAHKDNEKSIVPHSIICSISLGEARDFVFTRKNYKSIKLYLENGSVLIMKPPTNEFWFHSLPRSKVQNPRINITFRKNKVTQ